jgi:acylphosphatase
MEKSTPIHAHVKISGQVQGVGYRFATQQQARNLGLSGWVRNLSDGRVEAVFEGQREVVEAMMQWCQHGPPAAQVDRVEVDLEPPQSLQGFEIIRE